MKVTSKALRAGAALVATGALSGSGWAQSSVDIYGSLDLGFYSKQLSGESRTQTLSSGLMNASRWGIRGTEDLGGGLKARFDMSSYIRVDTGEYGRSATDAYWARYSWVGLENQAGTLRLGRISTPNFITTIRFNPFADSSLGPVFMATYLPSAAQPLMTSHGVTDSAWSNSIAYNTPSWNGWEGALQYAMSEGTTSGRRFGGSASYLSSGLSLALSVESLSGMALSYSKPPAVINVNTDRAAQLAAAYDFQVAKLFAQYQRSKLEAPGVDITLGTAQVGVSVPIGAGKALASYAHTNKEQTALADVKRQTVSLGYDYALSKRTDLYAVLLTDKVSATARGNGLALGIRHNF
ncbi:porin [Xylophilus rhododendri]|uniref:Porin n=1 Tax=Xylophilus rhododendri TaxID=2697032 RepID=A0A857J5H1_9BURK|nr:porin [Xylophilus rhododendri]QHI98473.1 porin [Xylophilus rhododendri]